MKNIYFVGAPTLAKGIEDFNYLAMSLPEFNFYWFTYKLKNSTKSNYKYIRFITGLEDHELKNRIIKDMDLFISCSYFEGFCLPIAEASLLGKPSISYKLEEVESEFGDTINYVKCFDKDEYKMAILKYSKSYPSRIKINTARNFITNNYSPEIVSNRLLEVFS